MLAIKKASNSKSFGFWKGNVPPAVWLANGFSGTANQGAPKGLVIEGVFTNANERAQTQTNADFRLREVGPIYVASVTLSNQRAKKGGWDPSWLNFWRFWGGPDFQSRGPKTL